MKTIEKNVMCVLLQQLLDQNLITQKIYENARERILDTFDVPTFFCCAEHDRKEETRGYTHNPY